MKFAPTSAQKTCLCCSSSGDCSTVILPPSFYFLSYRFNWITFSLKLIFFARLKANESEDMPPPITAIDFCIIFFSNKLF